MAGASVGRRGIWAVAVTNPFACVGPSPTHAHSEPRARLRALAARLALALASAIAAAALTGWSSSRLPALGMVAELAFCVAAWEAAVPASRALLQGRAVAPPFLLPCAVLLASVPAASAAWAALKLAGDAPSSPGRFYAQSVALGLLLAFARRGLCSAGERRLSAPRPAAASAPAPERGVEAFVRRHAPKLAGRRLLALEAEDHYLRLHTDGGSVLVLMRLRDAVAALGPAAGWQPHRSFWLAAGVEARAERSGQSWKLTLVTGLVVPVSRANLPRLRAAGHLPGT